MLLPVYNGERFIRRAVDSILAQTFTDFELVVVDDGSTDATATVLYHYADDPRVVVERLPTNQGLVAALNRGLEKCRGELIARLDADDVAKPRRLELQVRAFELEPRLTLCSTATEHITENGNHVRFGAPPLSHGAMTIAMLRGNRITHSSVMFRRTAVEEAGGYRSDWFPVEDYDLWLRMLTIGEFRGLPERLIQYTVSDGGISSRLHDKQLDLLRQRAVQYAEELVGAPCDEVSTKVVARSAKAIRKSLAQSGIDDAGLYRQALLVCNALEQSRGRLSRHIRVALEAPSVAWRGRFGTGR